MHVHKANSECDSEWMNNGQSRHRAELVFHADVIRQIMIYERRRRTKRNNITLWLMSQPASITAAIALIESGSDAGNQQFRE